MNRRSEPLEQKQIAAIAGQLNVTTEALARSRYDLEAHLDDDGLFPGWIIVFAEEPSMGISITLNESGRGAWTHVSLSDETGGGA